MIIDEQVTENSKSTFIKEHPFQTNYVISYVKHNIDSYDLRVVDTQRWYNPIELIKEHKTTLESVEESYHKLVNDYVALQKSKEIVKVKPEDIFKDSVNYHIQDFNCCLKCKWNIQNQRNCPFEHTHRHDEAHNPIMPIIAPVLCTNENNIRNQSSVEDDYNKILEADAHNRQRRGEIDDINAYYRESYIKRSYGVYPEVDPNGICENFEKYEML